MPARPPRAAAHAAAAGLATLVAVVTEVYRTRIDPSRYGIQLSATKTGMPRSTSTVPDSNPPS